MIANASITSKTVISAPDLLWTNPSPSAAFGEQTVSVNLTDYTGVIISFRDSATVTRYLYIPKATINSTNTPAVVSPGGSYWNPDSVQYRLVTRINNSGISFTSGRFPSSAFFNDNVMIPQKIYGVKWTI